MSATKRPSTSSLRRFIASRPFVTIAELRRRFALDDPDAMALLRRNGTSAWIGLPEREASKLQELWDRGELGVECSVEVRAPVAVGVYPMRIARYVVGSRGGNGHAASTGLPDPTASVGADDSEQTDKNGSDVETASGEQYGIRRQPRPMAGAPTYATRPRRLRATP